MPATATRDDGELSEEQRIDRWRFHRFLDLGFDVDAAIELTDAHADWHAVATQIARGCPPRLAVEIFA